MIICIYIYIYTICICTYIYIYTHIRRALLARMSSKSCYRSGNKLCVCFSKSLEEGRHTIFFSAKIHIMGGFCFVCLPSVAETLNMRDERETFGFLSNDKSFSLDATIPQRPPRLPSLLAQAVRVPGANQAGRVFRIRRVV